MELEEQTKREIRLKELELNQAPPPRHGSGAQADFDVNKCIRMIPPFNGKDVDKYFILFERTADTLKWPKNVWPLLLQCVFTGKAQEAYTSLSPADSLDYDKVKAAVLRAFELVPEAYRQKFRRYKKLDDHTFSEFGREKEALFDRWCHASKVAVFEQLRELILLEEFKNCLSDRLATYINEQKALTLAAATVFADEYVLTHRDSFERTPVSEHSSYSSWRKSSSSHSDNVPVGTYVPFIKREGEEKLEKSDSGEGVKERPTCSYCKKIGHTINKCFTLKNKSQPPKSVVLIKSESLISVSTEPVRTPDPEFQPFLMKGFVSLTEGDSKLPVNIIRDTASNQSVILEHVLPFSDISAVESDVLVRGFDMRDVGLPLHNIYLESDLIKGCVKVGVCAQLPIEGVTLLLGNDLAGGKMLINPEVIAVPLPENSDDLALKFPIVFSVCAVTRAMAERQKLEAEVELSDSFLVDCSVSPTASPEVPARSVLPQLDSKVCMSREQLVADQKRDVSLAPLFECVISGEALDDMSTGFFLKGNVLMRRWTPPKLGGDDSWGVVEQIVIPRTYRSEILKLAHDNPLSGHLGINKTFDRILRYSFWPGLKGDVRHHCKTCHVCQVAKTQAIPPYPLYPIPAIGEPFERVAQGKMKRWFDKGARSRSFRPGDKVLVLLPVPGSSLQARYSGPYLVKRKVGDRDYIIDTPERRRRSRLCHINMLKPYFDRESQSVSTPSDGPVVSGALELSSVGIADGDKVTLALSSNASVPPPESQDDQEDIVGMSSDVCFLIFIVVFQIWFSLLFF
ncbi:uncharacterized protein LOC130378840 [Gadus chalcogrammus]|nr:uncharacterized protein LOC130378840 [Gadus chalcogrammus]